MAELVREIMIDATPETIWPFLTEPDRHVEWEGTVAEIDPAARRSATACSSRGSYQVGRATYVEVVPMREGRVHLRLGAGGQPDHTRARRPSRSRCIPRATRRLVAPRAHAAFPTTRSATTATDGQHYLERLAIRAPAGARGPCRHGAGSSERMNVIALHDRARRARTTTIEKIDAAQLGDPTPCSEFDVRALLNHVIGGNLRFVAIAQGEPRRLGARDRRLRHRRRGDAVPRVGGRAVEGVERPGCPRENGATAVRRLPGRVHARHPHRRGRGAQLGPLEGDRTADGAGLGAVRGSLGALEGHR